MEWIPKNMDYLLIVASSFEELCERVMYLIKVCQRKNIKLSPKKMQVGRKVTFGGISISYDNFLDVVNLTPEQSKIEALKSLTIPKNKKAAQSLLGFVSQLNWFFSDINKK